MKTKCCNAETSNGLHVYCMSCGIDLGLRDRIISETETEDHKNETQEMQWLNNDTLDLRCVGDNPQPVDTAEIVAGFATDELDEHCDSLTREAYELNRLGSSEDEIGRMYYESDFYNDIDNY